MALGFVNSYGSYELTKTGTEAYLVSGPELEWLDDSDEKTRFLFIPNKDLEVSLSWSEPRKVWDFEIKTRTDE